jgi:hypothetical protein
VLAAVIILGVALGVILVSIGGHVSRIAAALEAQNKHYAIGVAEDEPEPVAEPEPERAPRRY